MVTPTKFSRGSMNISWNHEIHSKLSGTLVSGQLYIWPPCRNPLFPGSHTINNYCCFLATWKLKTLWHCSPQVFSVRPLNIWGQSDIHGNHPRCKYPWDCGQWDIETMRQIFKRHVRLQLHQCHNKPLKCSQTLGFAGSMWRNLKENSVQYMQWRKSSIKLYFLIVILKFPLIERRLFGEVWWPK